MSKYALLSDHPLEVKKLKNFTTPQKKNHDPPGILNDSSLTLYLNIITLCKSFLLNWKQIKILFGLLLTRE